MKKGIILSAFVFVLTVTTCFSNSQSDVKETRNLKGFTMVNFGISGDLYINLGSDFEVILEGDPDLLDNISTEVSGGKLVIKKENWVWNMSGKVTVYITMPEITGLGVSGSGKAEIRDAVKAENLNLSVSGSGKLYTTNIITDNLKCSISGSGDISLRGEADISEADVSISGSGGYTGEAAKIRSMVIRISGSGGCRCNVTESLKASVSGSGSVAYWGNPKVDARISGSGRVRSI